MIMSDAAISASRLIIDSTYMHECYKHLMENPLAKEFHLHIFKNNMFNN